MRGERELTMKKKRVSVGEWFPPVTVAALHGEVGLELESNGERFERM